MSNRTTVNAAVSALDSDLDAIAAAAANYLDEGEVVYDADGDSAGVTYQDKATQLYYAANIDECRALLRYIAAGSTDAYSLWCSDTNANEYDTQEEAAEELV